MSIVVTLIAEGHVYNYNDSRNKLRYFQIPIKLKTISRIYWNRIWISRARERKRESELGQFNSINVFTRHGFVYKTTCDQFVWRKRKTIFWFCKNRKYTHTLNYIHVTFIFLCICVYKLNVSTIRWISWKLRDLLCKLVKIYEFTLFFLSHTFKLFLFLSLRR